MFNFKIKEPSELKKVYPKALRFMAEVVKGEYRFVILFAVLSFAVQLLKVYVPVVIADLTSYLTNTKLENISTTTAWSFVITLFVVYLSVNCITFFKSLSESLIRVRSSFKVKKFALGYISGHSYEYISNQKAGQVAQRVVSSSFYMRQYVHAFGRIFNCFLVLLISFYFIGKESLLFLVLIIALGFVSVFISKYISKKVNKFIKAAEEENSRLDGALADSISNIMLVKIFGREKFEKKYIGSKIYNMTQATIIERTMREKLFSVQYIVLTLFQAIILFLSIYFLSIGKLEVSAVVLIFMLQKEVVSNFIRLSFDLTTFADMGAKLEKALTPFIDKHDMIDCADARELSVKKGDVEFNKITFTYPGKKTNLFEDFSLSIKSGEKVGIVGTTGSGKSTLAGLLQRTHDLQDGNIKIDGQDISKTSQSSLAQNIGVIPQDSSLFHRTIMQNIRFGNTSASQDDVIDASKKAYADEFVLEMPNGYDTFVGERGVKLSGGQRQRVSIARAILKNAPILILDEATSALDNESEHLVSEALENVMQGKTVIAIAHRLSTLKNMDRIIVLEKGKIIEDGTPEKLLAKKGKFAKLWKLQTTN